MAEIPLLITYIFGHEARLVYATAGERLLAWAQAFEDWLVERETKYDKKTFVGTAKKSWREFYKCNKSMPWEITENDVVRFARELNKTNASAVTKSRRLLDLSKFYEFCHLQTVDKPWAETWSDSKSFNPARDVRFKHTSPGEYAYYLDAEEVNALLKVIEEERTFTGKRDYGFMLGILLTGVSAFQYARLRWRDVEVGENEAWVHIFPENRCPEEAFPSHEVARRVLLPQEVWAAILGYLKDSGRHSQMRPHHYLFAPLKDPFGLSPSGLASDWKAERPISTQGIHLLLRKYAKAAGLEDKAVTYQALRNSSILMRLEAGDTEEEIREFLGWTNLAITKRRIKKIVKSAHEPCWSGKPPIQRKLPPYQFQPGTAQFLKHGFYKKDRVEPGSDNEIGEAKTNVSWLAKVERNQVLTAGSDLDSLVGPLDNMEKEIGKYREVIDRVFTMMEKIETLEDGIRLLDVYGKAINRLAIALRSQASLPNSKSSWERAIESVCMEIVKNDEIKAAERRRQQAALLDGGAGFYADEGESGLRQNGMDMPDVYPGDR
jgi:integrase